MLFILMLWCYITATEENNRKAWANGILIFYGICFFLGACMSILS